MKFQISKNDDLHNLVLHKDEKKVELNEKIYNYDLQALGNNSYMLRIGNKTHTLTNVKVSKTVASFALDGVFYDLPVKDEQQILLAELGFETDASGSQGTLEAPMPGKILEILVNVEDEVKTGQPLVILEAMKMENELKASVDGKVSEILVEAGTSVEKNSPLIHIEPIG